MYGGIEFWDLDISKTNSTLAENHFNQSFLSQVMYNEAVSSSDKPFFPFFYTTQFSSIGNPN